MLILHELALPHIHNAANPISFSSGVKTITFAVWTDQRSVRLNPRLLHHGPTQVKANRFSIGSCSNFCRGVPPWAPRVAGKGRPLRDAPTVLPNQDTTPQLDTGVELPTAKALARTRGCSGPRVPISHQT